MELLMPREGFHKRIKGLEHDVLEMGAMVIDAVQQSIEALKTLDAERAKRIIANDA
jgi:phosphate transport system protein